MEARKTDDRYVMKQEWDQQYHEYLLAQEPILLGGTKDSTHQDSTEHASQKKNTFFFLPTKQDTLVMCFFSLKSVPLDAHMTSLPVWLVRPARL